MPVRLANLHARARPTGEIPKGGNPLWLQKQPVFFSSRMFSRVRFFLLLT